MPGPIVHLIVQRRLPIYLEELGGAEGKQYADLLRNDLCSPYAGFGSMGPDYLFFSLKEYGTPLDELANFIFKVYDALEPFIEFYEENIEPVVEDIENGITTIADFLTGGLYTQIKDTAELMSSTALTAVGAVITSQVDLFYPFYPKLQRGENESSWYWFDFLHYRRTGQFCSNMWSIAGTDDDLRRYCLGYASHIGTDVVGHPYVNAVVGGPYRMHWHRHKIVENWIDAYARNYYPDDRDTIKCLDLGSDDNYRGNAISSSYYYRLCAFPDEKLPQKLGDMILKAMDVTYSGIPHPVTFNFDDLDTTYRLWLKWFKHVTSSGAMKKPTPVPPPGSGVITLVNDYVSGFPSFPGGSGSPGGGGFSLSNIFAAIFGFVKWLADVLTYTLEWIVTHAIDIITLPFTEALALLKWLLYQVQKGLYEIYDNLRFIMVLGGYFFPEPEDLAKSPWNPNLIKTPPAEWAPGVETPYFRQYPRKQGSHNLFTPIEFHLVYPGTVQERQHAEPAPKPFHNSFPEQFISQGFAYDPFIEFLYSCIESYGPNEQFTHFVDRRTWHTAQFGSVLHFCARLISARMEKLPNFNLDGDRGYGWKTWRVQGVLPDVDDIPPRIETNNPVPVDYIDA